MMDIHRRILIAYLLTFVLVLVESYVLGYILLNLPLRLVFILFFIGMVAVTIGMGIFVLKNKNKIGKQ
jgi:hypothetical protein